MKNSVEGNRERQRRWRERHLEKARQKNREYARQNPDAAKLRAVEYARSLESNPEKRMRHVKGRRANAVRYKLALRNRTPAWADLPAIQEFYRQCPEGYEVDHVIPLRGRLVSGLHVLNNLQYLPMKKNREKGNKHV